MDTTQPPLAEEQQFLLLIRQKGGRQVDKQVESRGCKALLSVCPWAQQGAGMQGGEKGWREAIII